MKKKKIGLALGSGGSRGVAHIGVLKALEEEGIKPDYITGCSMGSVVGACYSAGMTVDEMMETVMQIKPIDLIDVNLNLRESFLKGNKVYDMLIQKIGGVRFEDLVIPFQCVASDMLSNKLILLKEGEVATAVRASSAIPLVFSPVKYDDKLLIDGGVLCRIPVEQVRDMGADVVIAVDVLDNTRAPADKVSGFVATMTRVYDMIDNNRTDYFKQIITDDKTLWIVPQMEGMSQYKIRGLDTAYNEGYELTKQLMPQIKELVK
ncbi:MAG: patatin-like phospholipase family protein [Candidatus Coproplasma sp.]